MKLQYALFFGILSLLLIAGCTVTTSTPANCNAPFILSEKENFNKTIPDKESAYQVLMTIEPAWSQDSELYNDYKNSKVSDVEYKEISVAGSLQSENKYAYILKDQVAIDSEGQIYRKAGCI